MDTETNLAMADRGLGTERNSETSCGVVVMNDFDKYGMHSRQVMKEIYSEPARRPSVAEPIGVGFRERRGWWRRHGAFVGLVAWTIAGLLVGSLLILAFNHAEGFLR
jgi:hypothetical protein